MAFTPTDANTQQHLLTQNKGRFLHPFLLTIIFSGEPVFCTLFVPIFSKRQANKTKTKLKKLEKTKQKQKETNKQSWQDPVC